MLTHYAFVKRKFQTYNFSQSGALDETEMLAFAADLNQAASLDDVSDAVDALQEGGGAVDYDVFVRWFKDGGLPATVRNVIVSDWFLMRQLYKKYDVDGSQRLERGEVQLLAREHGVALAGEELDAAFSALDKDGDGLVGFEEFETWWSSVP
eukprot:g3330.t1